MIKKENLVVDRQTEQAVVPYNEHLLEWVRTQWQFGDWENLCRLDCDTLHQHPDRANISLMAAAGKLQIGDIDSARKLVQLAKAWGCSKNLIVRVLAAGVHNSLGRAAMFADDLPRAKKHFQASIAIGLPGSEKRLITKARTTEQVRQIQQILLIIFKPRDFEAEKKGRDERICKEVSANPTSSEVANLYGKAFYDAQKSGSELSARVVLSLLFRYFMPNSIIDVGCGTGAWMKVAGELGVEKILGIDGEYAVDQLVIPLDNFAPYDLSTSIDKYGEFGLAMSLEVAEHLDESRADGFVKDICSLSDAVLFSAAVPYQGGTDHRNENWPEYWAEKFEKHGYVTLDFIREKIWNDERVEWWYRQNILVFVNESTVEEKFPGFNRANSHCLLRIHPELYLKRAERR